MKSMAAYRMNILQGSVLLSKSAIYIHSTYDHGAHYYIYLVIDTIFLLPEGLTSVSQKLRLGVNQVGTFYAGINDIRNYVIISVQLKDDNAHQRLRLIHRYHNG